MGRHTYSPQLEVLLSCFHDCTNIQFSFAYAVMCHIFMTYPPSSSVFRFLKCAITIGDLPPHLRGYRPCFLAGIMPLLLPAS